MRIAYVTMAGLVLMAGEAKASPTFPDEIQQHLGLSYSPACSLCHAGGVTGFGTVTTPFGKAMRARGLTAGSITSLDAALDQMAADRVDSNGDGVTDIEELKAGTDPNANAPGAAPPPEFGCSAAGGHAQPGWRTGWMTLAAAAIALLRRRRVA